MKPAPFNYHRVGSRAEALDLLSTLDGARLIAGGQSLVPMLNMRYAVVDHLIDINRVPDLQGVSAQGDHITIGATTRQNELLTHALLRDRIPAFAEGLRFVGHVHTRNRGTIGGSLAHMDPAAELMALATLLNATILVESSGGQRTIEIADYPASYMTPNIAPGEMITGIRFTPPSPGHGWSFDEFARRTGDFAIAVAASVVELNASGLIGSIRIVVAGLDFAPRRLPEAEKALLGQQPSHEAVDVVAAAVEDLEAVSDALVSGPYRRRVARELLRRGLIRAFDRAGAAHD